MNPDIDKAVESFLFGLAFAVAMQLVKFPEAERPAVLVRLQEATSLYAPFTSDIIGSLVVTLDRP